jgi:hypothetical protein
MRLGTINLCIIMISLCIGGLCVAKELESRVAIVENEILPLNLPGSYLYEATSKVHSYSRIGTPYRYIYLPRTDTRGAEGYLFSDNEFVEGTRRNQIVQTPWGPFYWHGEPSNWRSTWGWLPYPLLLSPRVK